MVANGIGRIAVGRRPHQLAFVEIDADNDAVGRLDDRQPLHGGAEGGPVAAAPAGGGGGEGGPAITVEGLPIVKPPYGSISAISLDKGEILWQIAHGDTPDNIRNHAALKGVTIPRTGQNGIIGTLVTKTLLIAGEAVETTGNHPRGALLRAYDKATGKDVGGVLMPARQSGSPMTYMADGRQFIVVAVQGTGGAGGQYIAYALPR